MRLFSLILLLPLISGAPHLHKRGVREFGKGVGDSFVGVGKSLVSIVRDPKGAAKNLWYAVTHPKETVRGLYDNLKTECKAGKSRCAGRLVGLGVMSVGTMGAGTIAKAAGASAKGAAIASGAAVGVSTVRNVAYTNEVVELAQENVAKGKIRTSLKKQKEALKKKQQKMRKYWQDMERKSMASYRRHWIDETAEINPAKRHRMQFEQ